MQPWTGGAVLRLWLRVFAGCNASHSRE
jgi:hypothetical protein